MNKKQVAKLQTGIYMIHWKKLKIKWKVGAVPSGRYRSFDTRSWPTAYYGDENGAYAASIFCEDEYNPKNVKTGNHRELTLSIADYSSVTPIQHSWTRKVATRKPKTLKEAKELLLIILMQHPELMPQPKEETK